MGSEFRRFHDTVPSPLPNGALDRPRSVDQVAAAE
jgi:hypothetical protein